MMNDERIKPHEIVRLYFLLHKILRFFADMSEKCCIFAVSKDKMYKPTIILWINK